MTFEELENTDSNSSLLLDVRERTDYMLGTIKGAVNYPLDGLKESYLILPKDRPIYVFCRKGEASKEAYSFLSENGFDVYNLEGGYEAYLKYLMR